jgi:hypothetical protein
VQSISHLVAHLVPAKAVVDRDKARLDALDVFNRAPVVVHVVAENDKRRGRAAADERRRAWAHLQRLMGISGVFTAHWGPEPGVKLCHARRRHNHSVDASSRTRCGRAHSGGLTTAVPTANAIE